MSKFNIPDIVQVVPHVDYKVSVCFVDGKIVNYDLNPKLNSGIFKRLNPPACHHEEYLIMFMNI